MNVNGIGKYFNSAINGVKKTAITPQIKHSQSVTQDIFVWHKNIVRRVSEKLLVGKKPTFKNLAKLKQQENLTLVIDVRKGTGNFLEKLKCKLLGIRYINVPTSLTKNPSELQDEFKTVFNAINSNKSGTTFIHCRDGRHRSVMACAYYQIQQGKIKDFKELDYFLKFQHYYVVTPRKNIFSKFRKISIDKINKKIANLKVKVQDFANTFLPKQ